MDIGRVVMAKAGRDKGKYFVVVGVVDEDHVWIANGTTRTVDKPKKKKLKHLEVKPHFMVELKEKIVKGHKIFDGEIRKNIEALGYDK